MHLIAGKKIAARAIQRTTERRVLHDMFALNLYLKHVILLES